MQSNLAKVSPHTQMGHKGTFVQWYYYLQLIEKETTTCNPTDFKSKAHNSQQQQNKDI